MFFTPDFEAQFSHREFDFRMGSVLPKNKKLIADGLQHMSPESIRNRFSGIKSGFSERELNYLTDLDGINHYALGVQETMAPKRGVAVIRLVRLENDPRSAEVAITIIDSYQRQGLGSFLLDLVILAALERNIETLTFTYLRQNVGIERLIHKKGRPLPGPKDRDHVQYGLDLNRDDVEKVKARLRHSLPQIENYHLKT